VSFVTGSKMVINSKSTTSGVHDIKAAVAAAVVSWTTQPHLRGRILLSLEAQAALVRIQQLDISAFSKWHSKLGNSQDCQ